MVTDLFCLVYGFDVGLALAILILIANGFDF